MIFSVGAGRRRSRITVKPDTIDEVTTQVTDASPDLVLTDKIKVKVAIVLPHSMFMEREYKKQIFRAKSAVLSQDGLDFDKVFTIEPYLEMFHPIPAPTEVLEKICDQVGSRGWVSGPMSCSHSLFLPSSWPRKRPSSCT